MVVCTFLRLTVLLQVYSVLLQDGRLLAVCTRHLWTMCPCFSGIKGIFGITAPNWYWSFAKLQVELRAGLVREGIALSCRRGRLGASPHAYNSSSEVDQLVEALRSAKSQ